MAAAQVYAFCLAAYRTGDHDVNLAVVLILLPISYGNGQYYLERVCGNYHYKLGQIEAKIKSNPRGSMGNIIS